MEFTYTAMDARGSRVEQLVQADSEEVAIKRLQDQGLVILSLKSNSLDSGGRGGRLRLSMPSLQRRHIKREEVVGLSRELSIMIETGVPIVEALGLLAENAESPAVRSAVVATLGSVNQGRNIAQAMREQPRLFPKLYCDMVAAAEVGGTLFSTLNQAADYMEASQDLTRKVKGALTYPAVLMTAMVGVMTFMIMFLIPRFTTLFQHMNAKIPPTMHIMIMLSDFLRHQWWIMLLSIVAAIAGYNAAMRTRTGNRHIQRFILKIPIVGDTLKKVAISRVLRALGTLLESGVALLIALEAVSELAQNIIFEEAILMMQSDVERGTSLTDSMKNTHVFPAMVCQMVAVGEKAGRMNSVLSHVSRYYEQEIDARLKALTSIIEPVMIVILGIAVGIMGVSIFEPLYSIYDNIK